MTVKRPKKYLKMCHCVLSRLMTRRWNMCKLISNVFLERTMIMTKYENRVFRPTVVMTLKWLYSKKCVKWLYSKKCVKWLYSKKCVKWLYSQKCVKIFIVTL
jgi:hypothetical protein